MLWVWVIGAVILFSAVAPMRITDNKYEDVVIAIHPRIKKNMKIISELKEMVTKASPYMYQALRQRAYLKEVKIIIPETWAPERDWETSTTETFEEAEIRVDEPNPSYGNNPYTFQPRHCGEMGEYIHLTSDFVLDADGRREATWGDIGRTFVHEFAHLRYGVFDEYGFGNAIFPNFYLYEDLVYPTACTRQIKEGHYFENGKEVESCTIDPSTRLPGLNCTFVASLDGPSSKASIMYDQTLTQVTAFCESGGQNNVRHNNLAPNRQNKLCSSKGTWDVISQHEDFQDKNLPVTVQRSSLTPRVRLIQQKRRRLANGQVICGRPLVVVLDLSGSMVMGGTDRYFKQTQTADKLIRDVLPVGTLMGVVTFSTNATQHIPLTTLTSSQVRQNIASRLPKKAEYGGSTAIGKGLLKAKSMLQKAGKLNDGRIVLITDGEENREPKVNNIKGQLTQGGLKVHAIAYSKAAATSIKDLAQKTDGLYVFYSESPDSSALDSIFQSLTKDVSLCKNKNKIEVKRIAERINPPKVVRGQVHMDSTIGNDTIFVFTLPHKSSVDVTLLDPDRKLYSSTSAEYTKDDDLNIVRFAFPKAKAGAWNYTMIAKSKPRKQTIMMAQNLQKYRGKGPPGKPFRVPKMTGPVQDSIGVVVQSLPSESESYEVRSWLNSMSVDPNKGKPSSVYVHVHKGYSPVTSADVTVTVERPQSGNVKLKPKDDGKGADTTADDGVFTSYFTNFSGNSRYAWDVDVKSVPNKTELVLVSLPHLSMARSRYNNGTLPVVRKKVEMFTRSTSPGAMDVTGYKVKQDYFAPSRITDLRVDHVDHKSRTITLGWTAPGDDLNTGQASRYDIRMLNQRNRRFLEWATLQQIFLGGRIIQTRQTLSGIPPPHQAGFWETLSVRIRPEHSKAYFAIRTYDEAGHKSEISNIVTATFRNVRMAAVSNYKAKDLVTTTSEDDYMQFILKSIQERHVSLNGSSLWNMYPKPTTKAYPSYTTKSLKNKDLVTPASTQSQQSSTKLGIRSTSENGMDSSTPQTDVVKRMSTEHAPVQTPRPVDPRPRGRIPQTTRSYPFILEAPKKEAEHKISREPKAHKNVPHAGDAERGKHSYMMHVSNLHPRPFEIAAIVCGTMGAVIMSLAIGFVISKYIVKRVRVNDSIVISLSDSPPRRQKTTIEKIMNDP